MFQVKDRDRTLTLEGTLLATASSYREGAERWVEFTLYRTDGGAYVVSRVGYSLLYHIKGCPVVRPGRHEPAQVATLTADAKPCSMCNPAACLDQAHELIYPEKPLYFAAVCQTADGVMEAVAKYDADGSRYFTNVARALIHEAALKDINIGNAYYVERID